MEDALSKGIVVAANLVILCRTGFQEPRVTSPLGQGAKAALNQTMPDHVKSVDEQITSCFAFSVTRSCIVLRVGIFHAWAVHKLVKDATKMNIVPDR